MRTVSRFSALGITLSGITASSHAQVVGLEAEAFTKTYGGVTVHVMDIFASCTNVDHRVLLVWNTTIVLPGPPFHTVGEATTVLPLCPPWADPSVEADTFVTLGGDQCLQEIGSVGFTPDWDTSLLGESGVVSTTAGWYVMSPNCESNAAGPDLRVRLARLAIRDEYWSPGATAYCSWTIAYETCDHCQVMFRSFAAAFECPDDASSEPPVDLLGRADSGCEPSSAMGGFNPVLTPPVASGELASAESLWMAPPGWVVGFDIEGLDVIAATTLESLIPPLMTACGGADFDGDGDRDLLFRVPGIGGIWMWLFEDGLVDEVVFMGSTPGQYFEVLGLEDTNGDGRDGIVWRNGIEDRQVRVWLMNGATVTQQHQIGVSVLLEFLGMGDVSGDGRADILWRTLNGNVSVWQLNGVFFPTIVPLAGTAPVSTTWKPVTAADIDGDGDVDLLWRNTLNGNINGWLLENSAKVAGGLIAPAVGAQWSVAMNTDLDEDGDSDIVWRNAENGQINGWLMKGLKKESGGMMVAPGLDWTPIP